MANVYVASARITAPEPELRAFIASTSIELPAAGGAAERAYVASAFVVTPVEATPPLVHPTSGVLVGIAVAVAGAAHIAGVWAGSVDEQGALGDTPAASAGEAKTHPATGSITVAAARVAGTAASPYRPGSVSGVLVGAGAVASGSAMRHWRGMEAYPDLPRCDGTHMSMRSGMAERLAANGTYRTRAVQPRIKLDPTVVHEILTAAQRRQLLDFYSAQRVVPFEYRDELEQSRACVFAAVDPLQFEPLPEYPGCYKATVNLREI